MSNAGAGLLAVSGFALLVYVLVVLVVVVLLFAALLAQVRLMWAAGTWLQRSYEREDQRVLREGMQTPRPGEALPLRRTGPL